jgi:transcriptional regulator GlxA family with amidase domain
MAFVKHVRLERARDMRERTDNSDPSVTEAALACGFTNLGHFAGDYFKGFGERPSDTARRSMYRQAGTIREGEPRSAALSANATIVV